MQLDYGSLLSPAPIKLAIGSLRKPTLAEISSISFDKFNYYEAFLKMTPEALYAGGIFGDAGKSYWEAMSDEERESTTMFSVIKSNPQVQSIYVELFNFFFEETVIFKYENFIILRNGTNIEDVQQGDIVGVISEKSFQDVLELIQQTCCIYTKPKPSIDDMKFKNAIARRMYEKMMKAQEEQEKQRAKKMNKDHSIPNLISAVAGRHPNLNLSNIWGLTIFQLIEHFNRLQTNEIYEINKTRVSVWGDEKKTFDSTMWFKNNQDN